MTSIRYTVEDYHDFARKHNLYWVTDPAGAPRTHDKTWWICRRCSLPFYEGRASLLRAWNRYQHGQCPRCDGTGYSRPRYQQQTLELIQSFPYECTNFDSWNGNKYFDFSWRCSKGHEFSATVGYVTCRKCSGSAPEQLISKLLDDRGINYVREKRFDTCKRKSALPFDFYLPDHDMLIEYQGGAHHGKGIRFDFDMQYRQENDQIKRDWAKANNIELLEISATGITAITRIIETLVETQICHV